MGKKFTADSFVKSGGVGANALLDDGNTIALSGTNTGDNAVNTLYSGLAASKQDAITLTTTGTSGAATLIGATLNIPQYSGGGGDVTKVGTPVNDQVAIWTGDGTVEGSNNLTFDGSLLNLTGGLTASGIVTSDTGFISNGGFQVNQNTQSLIFNTTEALGGSYMDWNDVVGRKGFFGYASNVDENIYLVNEEAVGTIRFGTNGRLNDFTLDSAGAATFNSTISASNLSGTNTGDNAVNTLYSGLATSKQDTLVSATNIKTINGVSVLGAGDLVVTGGATNLSFTPSPTNGTVTSDTGTDATISLADGTNAGLITPAEKTSISTALQSLTGAVLTTTNQSISGTKTFNNVISGVGVTVDNGGSNTGIAVGNNLDSTGISVTSDGTGKGVVINNTTEATGVPFTVTKNAVDKLTINESGEIKQFGATSGDVTIKPSAVAGTATVITLPSVSGTVALKSDVGVTVQAYIHVGTTAPASPTTGTLWVDTN